MPEVMYLSTQDSVANDETALPDQSTVAPQAAPTPAWMPEVKNRIASFTKLGPNWNSYGAPKIERNAMLLSIALLNLIADASTPAPSVVPTVSGGVQLEWHQNGVDLEIEILGSGNVAVFHSDARGDDEWESDANGSVQKLRNLISPLGYARLRRN